MKYFLAVPLLFSFAIDARSESPTSGLFGYNRKNLQVETLILRGIVRRGVLTYQILTEKLRKDFKDSKNSGKIATDTIKQILSVSKYLLNGYQDYLKNFDVNDKVVGKVNQAIDVSKTIIEEANNQLKDEVSIDDAVKVLQTVLDAATSVAKQGDAAVKGADDGAANNKVKIIIEGTKKIIDRVKNSLDILKGA